VSPRPTGFSTRAIAAASRAPRVDQVPTAVPIYQAATFSAADAEELGGVLTGRVHGYAYSRVDNPTSAALAAAVADLEGAEAGYAFATGMAAIHAALVSLLRAGDRIVATRAVYGSTRSLMAGVLARLGVETTFVDVTDHAAVEAAFAQGGVRVLYAETISNPTIVVADHSALAGIAHRNGAMYVVDNTFASPYLCRPIELGADVVVESATKYLGGHSDVLAGVVVGTRQGVEAIKAIEVDTGGTLAPLSAFLVLRGIATLAVRMERHSASAAALAGWLESQAGVPAVFHPSRNSHPQHALASRQLALSGGMLAFELEGGRAAGEAFIDALAFTQRTASLGSVHTMVVHPPSTTHRQLDDAALAETGISAGLLRVSVGLEDLDDLIADFERGLAAARAAAPVAAPSQLSERPAPTAAG
jgi:cystathionine beta-lyase/cystathionine gamma-synthase